MEIKDLCIPKLDEWLRSTDYYTAPASSKCHGCYEGGLYRHSQTVAHVLVQLTGAMRIEWQNFRSPALIGLLHDVCKIGLYKKTDEGFIINTDRDLTRHGSRSVELLEEHGVQLTDEERYCIHYHMGEYTKDGHISYSEALQRCPNLLWVHTADMYASQILGR